MVEKLRKSLNQVLKGQGRQKLASLKGAICKEREFGKEEWTSLYFASKSVRILNKQHIRRVLK